MRRSLSSAVVMAAVLWAVAAQAASVSNELIPNYSGILAQTGGILETVPAQADYFIVNLLPRSVTQTWRIGFRLVDGAGNTVAGEVFSIPFTTTLAFHTNVKGTQTATLAPAALADGAPYRVSAQLYGQSANPPGWVAVGPADSSEEYRFKVVDAGSEAGVVPWLNTTSVTRAFAVATAPDTRTFQVGALGVFGRLEQVAQPVATDNYTLYFDVTLTGDNSGSIALASSRTTFPVGLANHTAAGGAAAAPFDQTLDLLPVAQLDSTDNYSISIAVSYAGPDGVVTPVQTSMLSGQRLLHFNGTLLFGPVATTIAAVSNDPAPLGTVPGVGENTTLGTLDNGGSLAANPAYTFTTGPDLAVLLKIDGTATTSDSVDLIPTTTPDVGTFHGISFTRDGIILDGTGAQASGRVRFPAGFGVSAAPNLRRLMPDYPLANLTLDASLNPTGTANLDPSLVDADSIYAVHEQLPEIFKAGGIVWDAAAGTLAVMRTDTLYVRRDEMTALNALPNTGNLPLAKDRPSNEGYYSGPAADAGVNVVIGADAQGRAVLLEARVDLPPGSYAAHFPQGANLAWTQTGAVVVHNGAIDPAQSTLPGAGDSSFAVSPRSPVDNGPAGVPDDQFTFSPAGATWTFTADGGLRADGAIANAPLRWGARGAAAFAEVTSDFVNASALVPGHVLRATLATTSNDNRAGELLLSGHGQPGDPSYVERPGAANYLSGFADYAGLNFRVAADGAQTATSLIGDAMAGPYALRATSKYYARSGGVSGIHAAVKASFMPLSGALTMYGFPLVLTDFQLSFRDNVTIDSDVSGTVTVPGARGTQGFSQAFTKMMFDPSGRPRELILPQPDNSVHALTYWNAQFHSLSAEFLGKPTDANTYALIFGAEVFLPGVVQEPIRGGLGFFSSGRMVAASDGFPGVNSRLKPPKLVSLHGTRSALDPTAPGFSAHPVSDIYFNDPLAAGAPDAGFIAFAGTVHVPFFQDVQVHVLARANGAKTSVRGGWSEGANTFFNNATFDASNRGFPSTVTCAVYENDAEPAGFAYFDPKDPSHQGRNLYNPIANQSWMGFVDFNLPLTWDSAMRRFVSSVPEQRDFLVVNMQRVIQQLTPSGADIRFGIQFNGLPRLNLAALVIDDQEATDQLIRFIPNGPQLVSGLKAFDRLLNNQSDELVSQGLDFALDQFLDDLFKPGGPLANAVAAADAVNAMGAPGSAPFMQLSTALHDRLAGIIGTVTDANSVMRDINDALTAINSGIGTADTLLAKDAQGKRGAFITQTVNLAVSIGLPARDVTPVTDSITTLINGELAPTLDDIQSSLDQVHSLTTSAQGVVGDVEGLVQSALDAVNTVGALPDQVLGAMKDYFQTANDPTGRLLAEMDPAKLRADLKRAAHDVIMQSGFITELQSTLRDLIEPVHDQYYAMFEQIFGVLNDVVRSALQELSDEVVDHLNDIVGQVNRAIGSFSDTLRLTQVEGTAHIIGDVLDRAHVNGTLALHVPDPVTLLGTIDFTRQRGDQPVPGCASGIPDGRMQITLTGKGNASLAGNPPVHAVAQGQYTMNSSGAPLAVSGKFSVDSDIHFDIVGLKHAEFDFAFGALDNYIMAQGAGNLLIFDVDTRAFLGRTCDATLLNSIDPQLASVFNALGVTPVDATHPVTGYYFRSDGDVLLNRLLGIPDDVVTLKGKGGQGSFAFCNDNLTKVIPGVHWRFGLSVGFGGASADAELNALGGLDPLDLVKTDNVADIATSLFTKPGLITGAVSGRFKPTFSLGPVSWSQDFNFTAYGSYTPPPVAPPPGFFFVNKLDF